MSRTQFFHLPVQFILYIPQFNNLLKTYLKTLRRCLCFKIYYIKFSNTTKCVYDAILS